MFIFPGVLGHTRSPLAIRLTSRARLLAPLVARPFFWDQLPIQQPAGITKQRKRQHRGCSMLMDGCLRACALWLQWEYVHSPSWASSCPWPDELKCVVPCRTKLCHPEVPETSPSLPGLQERLQPCIRELNHGAMSPPAYLKVV